MEIIYLKSDDAESVILTPQKTAKENKVTDLKSGVRNQNRVNVFIDGEFAFSLDLSQVVDFHLKIGKILKPDELAELKRASAYGKLYSQTLEWVLLRPRSVKETRDHLTEKLFKIEIDNRRRAENRARIKQDPEFKRLAKDYKIRTRERELFEKTDIEKVIEQLLEKGYLNDRKFAEWFIENRFIKKGVSALRLRGELTKKGIDKNLIDELLENSPRDEAEEIKKVIQKRGPKTADQQKLLAYLARHGFSLDLSRELVKEYYETI